MGDSRQERALQFDSMREALTRQPDKPVGARVEGMVVAAVGGHDASRMRAMIEADRAVHIIERTKLAITPVSELGGQRRRAQRRNARAMAVGRRLVKEAGDE